MAYTTRMMMVIGAALLVVLLVQAPCSVEAGFLDQMLGMAAGLGNKFRSAIGPEDLLALCVQEARSSGSVVEPAEVHLKHLWPPLQCCAVEAEVHKKLPGVNLTQFFAACPHPKKN